MTNTPFLEETIDETADEAQAAAPGLPAQPSDTPAVAPGLLLHAEAILFVASDPVEHATLARVLAVDPAGLPALIAGLRDRFADRGIRVQDLDGKLQLVSAPEAAPILERFLGTGQTQRLSAAALEVLAIVAYRQPLTRAQIEAVRGVDSSGVLRSLLARDLIHEVGRSEALGRPILYATTAQFLHLFGLESLADLPSFAFGPEQSARDDAQSG